MASTVQYGGPVLFALLAWWFSTGAILYLDGLPRRSFRWTMTAITLALGPAAYGLISSSQVTSAGAAYAGFASALIMWAWLELSFLTGYVTGPRCTACPEDCAETNGRLRHFIHASQAIIYHELAAAAFAAGAIAMTWGEPNQTGTWTILLLWIMRLSAKLNLHFGVPNLSEEFLPVHLAYLRSFLRRRPMNPLFPFSITLGTGAIVMLLAASASAPPGGAEATGLLLLASLLALAVLEHWFMVLPIPAAALWRWGFRSHEHEKDSVAAAPLAQAEGDLIRGAAATGVLSRLKHVLSGTPLPTAAGPSFDPRQ